MLVTLERITLGWTHIDNIYTNCAFHNIVNKIYLLGNLK